MVQRWSYILRKLVKLLHIKDCDTRRSALYLITKFINNQNITFNLATFKSIYEACVEFTGGKFMSQIINDFLCVPRLLNRQSGGGKIAVLF
jgi:hypothetical protein